MRISAEPISPTCAQCPEKSGTCFPYACKLYIQKKATDKMAKSIYEAIRRENNPLGKNWDELTEYERKESQRLAKAAWEAL